MGDGQNRHDFAILIVRGDQNDRTGTILAPFFMTALLFLPPQIGVADNQTGNGGRKHHLGDALIIEGRRLGWWFRLANRLKICGGELCRPHDPTVAPLEALILLRGQNHEAFAAIARDRDGFLDSLVLIASEISLEVGRGDGKNESSLDNLYLAQDTD